MKQAFTLVELAIVIVIIGLLVGGVLQGKELITQSKVRSQIKQLQEYDTAIVTFKGKYNSLPGDIARSKAGQFAFDLPDPMYTYCDDEDGVIRDYQGSIPSFSAWCEPMYFLRHLAQAKVIKATFPRTGNQYAVGLQFPTTKLGDGGFFYTTRPDGNLYAYLGLTQKDDSPTANSHFLTTMAAKPLFIPEEAYALDEKMDDGNPITGKVQAVLYNIQPDTTANTCITNITDQKYNLIDAAPKCRLVVKTSL